MCKQLWIAAVFSLPSCATHSSYRTSALAWVVNPLCCRWLKRVQNVHMIGQSISNSIKWRASEVTKAGPVPLFLRIKDSSDGREEGQQREIFEHTFCLVLWWLATSDPWVSWSHLKQQSACRCIDLCALPTLYPCVWYAWTPATRQGLPHVGPCTTAVHCGRESLPVCSPDDCLLNKCLEQPQPPPHPPNPLP